MDRVIRSTPKASVRCCGEDDKGSWAPWDRKRGRLGPDLGAASLPLHSHPQLCVFWGLGQVPGDGSCLGRKEERGNPSGSNFFPSLYYYVITPSFLDIGFYGWEDKEGEPSSGWGCAGGVDAELQVCKHYNSQRLQAKNAQENGSVLRPSLPSSKARLNLACPARRAVDLTGILLHLGYFLG